MPARSVLPLWNSLALDRGAQASLQDQIVGYFRAAVLEGRLEAGARVPSSRALAGDHGVARITAVQAYERLMAEGYLESRPGSGLFVAENLPEHPARPAARPRRADARPPRLGRDKALGLPPRPFGHLPLTAGLPALDR